MKARVLPVNERLFTAGMAPRPFEIVFAETIFALIAECRIAAVGLNGVRNGPKWGSE
jgi:hypothetical protein